MVFKQRSCYYNNLCPSVRRSFSRLRLAFAPLYLTLKDIIILVHYGTYFSMIGYVANNVLFNFHIKMWKLTENFIKQIVYIIRCFISLIVCISDSVFWTVCHCLFSILLLCLLEGVLQAGRPPAQCWTTTFISSVVSYSLCSFVERVKGEMVFLMIKNSPTKRLLRACFYI